MRRKGSCHLVSYDGATLNLRSCPNAQFQYVLELFRKIIPTVMIAGRMCRKIVVNFMNATGAMCDDVIGLPRIALDRPSANVTAP